MRSATVREIAPQGLSAVEAVAVHATQRHGRQRLRHDHLGASAHQRHRHPEERGELSGRGSRRYDEMVTGEPAAARPDSDYAAASRIEPQRPGVLQQPSAAITQRPCISLQRAMRIRMSAEMMEIAAEDILPRERHELPHLLRIQHIGTEPLPGCVLERMPVERELPLIERNSDPIRLELGRVAEQLVHQGPQALLFPEERTVMMRATAAVAPRCAPARGSRLDHEGVDTLASEPPAGAQSGDSTADDDDRGAVALALAGAQAHSPATGSCA